MRYSILLIIIFVFYDCSLYSQTTFVYKEQPWNIEFTALKGVIQKNRNKVNSIEIQAKISEFLSDKPVHILLVPDVWDLVGSSITNPYSRTFSYVYYNISKFPKQKQIDIINQLNSSFVREVGTLTSFEGTLFNMEDYRVKAEYLKQLLGRYVLPKSALYITKLNIKEYLIQKEYLKAFITMSEGDRINLFYKEERYCSDVFREIIKSDNIEVDLIKAIYYKVLNNQEKTNKTRALYANYYDILSRCCQLLGDVEQSENYKEIYLKKREKFDAVYGDLLNSFRMINEQLNSNLNENQ